MKEAIIAKAALTSKSCDPLSTQKCALHRVSQRWLPRLPVTMLVACFDIMSQEDR